MLDRLAHRVPSTVRFHDMSGRRAPIAPRLRLCTWRSVLTIEQIDAYHRDGFLVIEGFAATRACADAEAPRRSRSSTTAQPTAERTVFTTNEQERVEQPRVPRQSGSTTWCFFEEEAFDDDGALRQAKELSINKIGHAMHDLDPMFERFTYTPSWPRSPPTSACPTRSRCRACTSSSSRGSAARSAATRTRRSCTPTR